MKYLFICNGNVARSQQAEIFFNSLKHDDGDQAESAGTDVIVGKPINPDVVQVTKELGFTMEGAYRKFVTPEMADSADRVVSFKPIKDLPEFLRSRKGIIFWNVPDPRGQSLDFHRTVRDEVLRLVTDLINKDDKRIR